MRELSVLFVVQGSGHLHAEQKRSLRFQSQIGEDILHLRQIRDAVTERAPVPNVVAGER
jgi:hypothetical protein